MLCDQKPKAPRGMEPLGRLTCRREDSNFHGISPTWPSTMRVYQFRHSDVGSREYRESLPATTTAPTGGDNLEGTVFRLLTTDDRRNQMTFFTSGK